MKKSVGLVIITKKTGSYSAVLQKRKEFSKRKDTPEKFPGCLQIPCKRKLAENKNPDDVIFEAITKKLGKDFAELLKKEIPLQTKEYPVGKQKQIIVYHAFVPRECLVTIIPYISLVYESEDEIDQIIPITEDMEFFRAPDNKSAMLGAEIIVVRKVLEIIKQ